MKTSLIINTCAGSKDEATLDKGGTRGNRRKKTYRERAPKLKECLRRYTQYNLEIIVVGEWEEGEGYTYIEDIGKLHDPSDQAQQRHTGVQAASGDILLFLNDDHYLDLNHLSMIADALERWGAIGFIQYTIRPAGLTINLNQAKNKLFNYIPGHASAFRRDVIERVPWNTVEGIPTWTDVLHCEELLKAEINYNWRTYIPVWDIEEGDIPDE